MKDMPKFIILGLLIGALISCQHTQRRDLTSIQLTPSKVTYGVLQQEVNGLLEKTNDLQKYTVAQPDIL
ncbi:MAG: hypothetical protein A2381_13020 [Bdellovibrionales bacterium RIFOXYB1_FULL_37_110]|nr:MAG: hypothetical protein A2181_02345 [Bdellovibrionales bacterium RIFOXYA1_FULL_38_20]OFZ51629.1 MAG: hypothetical protein A2417_12680 [Bdellovibrionales bacterium RIFOXYC1_FULL_37_79]OFZ60456.1 MAG: hypothetical protein A2381_13020 [Bdellovibrionales bacterium RIFOXYB1_FULL_37_110]OFZ65029.1 MAG: hypothetical protein A2577_09285 [Bdellovibrionales bacterium RIFOXYD1_FULL_36_51]OFZ67287.1 MAG: hypothetical protein A2328_10545 [Bdellovibrionales bacterium RIFOXYB2_FULL_36_6]